MGIGVVSLIVLVVVVLIAIPVLTAVFGRASRHNENHQDSEGSREQDSSEEDQGRRSGPRRG